jgi:hypothetical protein
MRRSIVVLAMFALIAGSRQHAAAADPLSGTVSCTAVGELPFGPPYLPAGLAEPVARPLRMGGHTDSATCDGAGVVGARAPLYSVVAHVSGKFAPGTSCSSFLGTLSFAGKVKLRWIGNRQGSLVSLGASRATVASAGFDSATESWVIVTTPIKGGAFAGKTVTMHFSMFDATRYAEQCATSDFRYAGWAFGPDNPWLIDVQ